MQISPRVRLSSRACAAELTGTAFLLVAVVGSGIMGERLAGGNVAIALLANATATGMALVALILCLEPISGAHFNPAVSLAEASQGRLRWSAAGAYVVAQVLGAFLGVGVAHVMFEEPLYTWSTHARGGSAQIVSEMVATCGLLLVIRGCARRRHAIAFAVGAYIAAAYWFTASTSFANPAATLARAATETFVGIRPLDVPGFVFGQITGAAAATLLFNWLAPGVPEERDSVVVPRDSIRAKSAEIR